MAMPKRVGTVEEAEFKGTEEVYVNTTDGWTYVFQRPSGSEAFRFKHKRRPDGSKSPLRHRTPEAVVEYMEKTYDCGNLHPEFKKSEGGWDDV